MEVLGAIALAILLAVLGHYVQSRGADPAHYFSFFVAIVLMYDPLKKLGRVVDFLTTGAASAERIFEVIDLPPSVRDRPGAANLPTFADRVVYDHVTFAYDDGRPVLEGVDLELKLGQVVALVGASGSGKTTMANLLVRFYDVLGGRLTIDGHDLRDLRLASLRGQISVVSQDTFLFNASVRENIAYGSPDATDEQIRQAAEAAHASEFVDRLPDGYATVVGERGVTLSGGQQQRLAIARALLRNTPLLILDEATSSLDIESERFVQQALDRLMQGRTSLVIAHRLSTVRNADLIAVLKAGRIVERGRHGQLLAQGGEYARLYELQFAGTGPAHTSERGDP
jgi:subfamily B ATP-binding cassette protein MsbA